MLSVEPGSQVVGNGRGARLRQSTGVGRRQKARQLALCILQATLDGHVSRLALAGRVGAEVEFDPPTPAPAARDITPATCVRVLDLAAIGPSSSLSFSPRRPAMTIEHTRLAHARKVVGNCEAHVARCLRSDLVGAVDVGCNDRLARTKRIQDPQDRSRGLVICVRVIHPILRRA